MYQYSFEKLSVWQEARLLVKNVYSLMADLPKEEFYALASQIKRAAISVSSNIAEGTSRISYKEKIRYIAISYGSLMELYSQLILCIDLNYLTSDQTENVFEQIQKISNQLNSLKRSYESNK